MLLDSGFYAAWVIEELEKRKIAYVVRLPASVKNIKPTDVERTWFEIATRYRREGRRRRKSGPSRTVRIRARIIEYRVDGSRGRLLTNLPQDEITDEHVVGLFHQRWEIELANDEIKTHLAAPAKGTAPLCLRSRTPEFLEQEIYALLALYNLLRANVALAAARVGVPAIQMSFTGCLNAIRRACLRPAPKTDFETLGAWVRLVEELKTCVLDRPRRPRRAPRVVRKPIRGFPGKRPRQRSRHYDIKDHLQICRVRCRAAAI